LATSPTPASRGPTPDALDPKRGRGIPRSGGEVLVVGLGRTGVSVARYFLGRGCGVRVTDREPRELPGDLAGVRWVPGDGSGTALEGVDLVVPSPGVPCADPLLKRAVERGIPVRSEIEIAADDLRIPMVAITGTNGKSTTTALTAHLLGGEDAGIFAGGNLGTPLIEAVGLPFAAAVVEVSSFQLEWTDSFRPEIAVWLNLSDDHLDRHGDLDSYAEVKARLFAAQAADDLAILNRDDARVEAYSPALRARVATFGRGPHRGDGALVREGILHARLGERTADLPLEGCSLIGDHNVDNVMAAVLVAMARGRSDDEILAGLQSFAALPHRMELVAERGGIRWVDDSKATNLGALERSIQGLPDGRVVLVAGGVPKGGDFASIREALSRKLRRAFLYGQARELLAAAWAGAVDFECHELFTDAVRAAALVAREGDTILLSPACASFDQFRNYAERGDAFAALAREVR
jgi:UDP-N-acetylmuramoylalanine--D-glutamate ligase